MKNSYKTIILVSDGTPTSAAAETTTLNLAQQHSAKVLVVDAVRPGFFASNWFKSNSDKMFDVVIADKRERLKKIGKRFENSGLKVDVEVLIGKSSEEISRAVLEVNADLVVRYRKGSASKTAGLFGSTSRNLMRVCPCPLLLVGDEPVSNPSVMACVNAEHEFEENEAILNEAKKLSSQPEKLLALYCWEFYGREFMKEYMDESALKGYLEEAEQNYQSLFDRFLKNHDLDAFKDGVKMENGDPIQVIPEVCRHESVNVVVMSSASQNHPLHRLLGSTVESVLDALPCALLVVKPLGFKSPIKPARSKVEIGNS